MTRALTNNTEAHETATDTPSGFVRGWSGLIAVAGVIVCLTPLWWLGIAMVVVGLYVAGATVAVAPVEAAALTEAQESGGGCGWLALAVAMIGVVGVVGLLGLAMLGAVVEGGGL